MDSGTILQLMFATFMLAAKVSAPLLITALVVGLLVSLFQAVTQINDSTLSFLPKIVTVAFAFWLSWPWLTQEMTSYMAQIFHMMGKMPR